MSKLSIYHAKQDGTGSAVQFEVIPAKEIDGCAYDGKLTIRLAAQKKSTTLATFDWDNAVKVALNFEEICKFFQVLRGETEEIAGGLICLHAACKENGYKQHKTLLQFKHQVEYSFGYWLNVTKAVEGADDWERFSIFFTPAEALGLSIAIEQSLSLIAFGNPIA